MIIGLLKTNWQLREARSSGHWRNPDILFTFVCPQKVSYSIEWKPLAFEIR